jgi:hypothetical protein
MDELEKYECFGVPAHVWSECGSAVSPVRPTQPRPAALPEGTLLGVEALPWPGLPELLPFAG